MQLMLNKTAYRSFGHSSRCFTSGVHSFNFILSSRISFPKCLNLDSLPSCFRALVPRRTACTKIFSSLPPPPAAADLTPANLSTKSLYHCLNFMPFTIASYNPLLLFVILNRGGKNKQVMANQASPPWQNSPRKEATWRATPLDDVLTGAEQRRGRDEAKAG
ncbi:hypothetical protein F2P81_013399 [Scophthalmus maximus]|uniref:Uncharacterized protein n=1 Tax=Scophthalmus maximus TaxID=52904 RepID=A0A6A4SGR8_SCOMX|nr:hypothetical protein F2P81_013399 [Scophthalmus maximus]